MGRGVRRRCRGRRHDRPAGSPRRSHQPERRQLAGEHAITWSGGAEFAGAINPAAVASMAERGIDISGEFPKPWTEEIVRAADVVVTMGCGDACPVYPGRRYLDWELDDPAGKGVKDVRPIRDEIERRVRALLADLGLPSV
ncbi:phosphotyrosine protein phosphatase [Streptosporangium canum]|uniref:arsenate reductase/protein-tyrosine-phosphatase family protein n=1 Tax=Streptosporangium canum TaxID=324952 RepID=UPI00367D1BD4